MGGTVCVYDELIGGGDRGSGRAGPGQMAPAAACADASAVGQRLEELDDQFAREPCAPGLKLALHRDVHAPAAARAALRRLCDEVSLPSRQRHTLVLLVSELVSNAVRHSQAPAEELVSLDVCVGDASVRASVTDGGRGFAPVPAREPAASSARTGLCILDSSARSWGVDHREGTRVWFELPVHPATVARAPQL